MYERRKVLLGLIEAFGGELARTDCVKLLFLLGQQTGVRRHYEFFPYLYGPFSYAAMQDKRRLEELGYLRHAKAFALSQGAGQHLNALTSGDRLAVASLRSRVGSARGRELMRRVYVDFPTYCRKSRVMSQVLDAREAAAVRATWNDDRSPLLFTIGYQGHTIDSFLRCLIDNSVNTVVDVRKNAFSMKYDFSKRALQRYLAKSGIDYIHVPELGIDNTLRKTLTDRESYRSLMVRYEQDILPALGSEVAKVAQTATLRGRVALMCFEADYLCCHRHVLAEAVAARSGMLPILHLSGQQSVSA